jgi:predicted transcriptional regulator
MPAARPNARADTNLPAPPGTDSAQLVDRIASELDLLARNVDILERLSSSPPMGIIRLSEALHLPIHKVRYSLHLLEREGVIQPSADGAVVTERAKEFWTTLDQSLDRMTGLIQHLKDRANEYKGRGASAAGRKGY